MRVVPRLSDDDDRAEASRAPARLDPLQALELLGRRLGGAILVGSALIALALYAGEEDGGPKYQAFAADGEVFRVNTESGTIIACNAARCTRILERGQDLAEDQGNTLFSVRFTPDSGPPRAPQGGVANPPAPQPARLPPPQPQP